MRKMNRKKLATGILIVFSAMAGIWIIPANFEIVPNYSESLPYKWVLVKKGLMPSKRDQTFVFYVRDNALLGVEKIKFIKLVGGLPGDEIESKGGEIFFGKKMLPHFQDDILTHDDFFHTISLAKLVGSEEFQKKDITIIDKEIYVAGKLIGVAKPYTKKVEELIKMKSDFDANEFRLHSVNLGKIPSHKFFAYTPHKDSFDSRYQEIGFIDEKDIIGTAILTF